MLPTGKALSCDEEKGAVNQMRPGISSGIMLASFVAVHNDRSGTEGHGQRGGQAHLLVGIRARDRYTPLPARQVVRKAPRVLHARQVNYNRNTGGGGWLTEVHGGRSSGHRGRLPASPEFSYISYPLAIL